MGTFIMFGRYSQEAIKQISSECHQKIEDLLKKFGGEMKGEYCMLVKRVCFSSSNARAPVNP